QPGEHTDRIVPLRELRQVPRRASPDLDALDVGRNRSRAEFEVRAQRLEPRGDRAVERRAADDADSVAHVAERAALRGGVGEVRPERGRGPAVEVLRLARAVDVDLDDVVT